MVACEADLAVDTPEILGLGNPLLANAAAGFTVRQRVSNNGPAAEADAMLTETITAPADCTVDPASDTRPVPGLSSGETRSVDIPVTLVCADPSDHALQVSASVVPAVAALTDPVSNNNGARASPTRSRTVFSPERPSNWTVPGRSPSSSGWAAASPSGRARSTSSSASNA